jgi:hypothetical protein
LVRTFGPALDVEVGAEVQRHAVRLGPDQEETLPGQEPALDRAWPRAALSFYTIIDCRCLSSLRGLHKNLAIAIIFCQNNRVAPRRAKIAP